MKKHIYIAVSMLAIMLAMQACTFEEPTLPTWFNEFTIPIPSPGFTVREAINDSTIVDTTDAGEDIIAISISDSLEPQQVDRSDLAIKPENDQFSQTIGDIRLNSPPAESSDSIFAADILDTLGSPLQAGQTVNILQFIYDDAPPQYLTFEDFDTVDVKNGSLQIEFFNNSFINIRSGMEIYIYDHDEINEIGIAVFSTSIDSFSSALSDPVDLASQSFSNDLRFEMHMPVAAGSRLLSESDVNSFVYFIATISELTVTKTHAVIPEQEFSTVDSVSLADQEDKMIRAHIDEGGFDLIIDNRMPVSAYVTVELLNFYTSENYDPASVLRLERFELQAASQDSVQIQLDDFFVTNYPVDPQSNEIIDYLNYQVFVETIPSGGEKIQISEDDSIIVSVNVTDSIYVREFYGIIAPVEIDIEPQEQSDIIPIEDIEGSFLFDDLVMDFNVFNEIGVAVDVELDIVGYKNNRTESIRLEFNPNPFTVDASEAESEAKETAIRLDSSNSNIVSFLEFLPEDIFVSGTAFVEGEGFVTLNDRIWGNYYIYSPFYLRIENNPSYTSEIKTITIDSNIMDAIAEEKVQDTRLEIEVINGLPVGGQLIIYAAIDSTNLFSPDIPDSSKKLILDEVDFSPGIDLNSDRFVDEPTIVPYQRSLSDKEVSLFSNNPLFVGTEILMENSDGVVKLRQSDEVKVEGVIKIRYRMH